MYHVACQCPSSERQVHSYETLNTKDHLTLSNTKDRLTVTVSDDDDDESSSKKKKKKKKGFFFKRMKHKACYVM